MPYGVGRIPSQNRTSPDLLCVCHPICTHYLSILQRALGQQRRRPEQRAHWRDRSVHYRLESARRPRHTIPHHLASRASRSVLIGYYLAEEYCEPACDIPDWDKEWLARETTHHPGLCLGRQPGGRACTKYHLPPLVMRVGSTQWPRGSLGRSWKDGRPCQFCRRLCII